ncbi:MAG: Mrp/NBP35 family ATP-binding protein [Candidatus Thermoplasmatota archaeon]
MPDTVQEERKKQRTEQQARLIERMGRIKNKWVVMSGKGGVGKTTVAVNLACGLAGRGALVGLMDADIHGPNVPKMLGIEGRQIAADENGIIPIAVNANLMVISMAFFLPDADAPVIWRGPMKMTAINQFLGDVQWGDLDYLVVDLPPGTGDEPLSIAQLIPGAEAIIVTTPQDVALLDSRKAVNFARALHMPVLGIIENMSGMKCPHCGKEIDLFKTGGGERAAKELGVPFLGRLPIDQNIVLMGDAGKPLTLNDERSDAARAFLEIVTRIENTRR